MNVGNKDNRKQCMDLTMEYKNQTFDFELLTNKRGNRQLWMDKNDFQEWKRSTAKLSDDQKRKQEEYEFYTAVQGHLEILGRSYELWVDKFNFPYQYDTLTWYIYNDDTLDWYIDDDVDEE